MENSLNRSMIKPLTSLRFFFALMVFFHHVSFVTKGDSVFLKKLYQNVLSEGFIGVNFFFILSGFILTYNYQEKFRRGLVGKRKFWVARFARIYPLHLLTLLLSVPILCKKIWIGNKIFWGIRFLAHLFLVQSFIPIKSVYLNFNRPAWSISDEAFFYFVFPFLIGWMIKKDGHVKLGWTLLGLSGIPLLMWLVPENLYHPVFYVNPLIRLADFALGILLFNFYKNNQNQVTATYASAIELLAVLLLIVFFMGHTFIPEVLRYSVYYWFPMGFLIVVLSYQKGMVSKVLSNRHLLLLGEVSFGFYMFHHLVIKYYELINQQFFNIQNDYLSIGIIFVATILVSYLSYFYFEKKANRYLKNKLTKP